MVSDKLFDGIIPYDSGMHSTSNPTDNYPARNYSTLYDSAWHYTAR